MTQDNSLDQQRVGITSLYELNKQGYKDILPYNDVDFHQALTKIEEWFEGKRYCMLLCKERSDYTVFNFCSDTPDYEEAAHSELKECLDNRGGCLDIKYDICLDGFEVWMRIDKEVYMFYLFECGDFILEV